MATPTNPPFNPLAEVALEPDLWGWPRWLRELIRVFNDQAHRHFWVRELIFSAKIRPRTDVVQRGLLAVLFFNFVNMASSAKSFVRKQTNSRYAETRVPSSEKLTRISEELELRKPSTVGSMQLTIRKSGGFRTPFHVISDSLAFCL